jgi:hypothetical protein
VSEWNLSGDIRRGVTLSRISDSGRPKARWVPAEKCAVNITNTITTTITRHMCFPQLGNEEQSYDFLFLIVGGGPLMSKYVRRGATTAPYAMVLPSMAGRT